VVQDPADKLVYSMFQSISFNLPDIAAQESAQAAPWHSSKSSDRIKAKSGVRPFNFSNSVLASPNLNHPSPSLRMRANTVTDAICTFASSWLIKPIKIGIPVRAIINREEAT
jgi:hypothetical protein